MCLPCPTACRVPLPSPHELLQCFTTSSWFDWPTNAFFQCGEICQTGQVDPGGYFTIGPFLVSETEITTHSFSVSERSFIRAFSRSSRFPTTFYKHTSLATVILHTFHVPTLTSHLIQVYCLFTMYFVETFLFHLSLYLQAIYISS